MQIDTQELIVVGRCPVLCGIYGVIVLMDAEHHHPVFFSPCCGAGWSVHPGNEVNEIRSLASIAPRGVVIPSHDEVVPFGLGPLVTARVRWKDWQEDLSEVAELLRARS